MARIIDTADLTPSTFLNPDDAHWIYNGLDCCVTKDILDELLPQLDDTSRKIYDFSLSLQAPVMEMMQRGLRVNKSRRNKVLTIFEAQSAQLEEQMDRLVRDGIGVEINWRSPKQLGELFYGVMNLPVQKKKNANGVMAPTTNREAIEKLSYYTNAEPLCNHLLALRDLQKKISFLKTGIDYDGRMRTNFNIAGTNTGRLASSESNFGTGTNLQNVDRLLRSVFMADKGMKFGNLDLEQADARNLGALCWEQFVDQIGEQKAGRYLDACEAGDLHTFVCKLANPSLPWGQGNRTDREIADEIAYRQDSHRDLAKKLGHGTNFLGSPYTMAKHSKLPQKLIQAFQNNYFHGFPAIPMYHEFVKNQLETVSSLTTLLGRRRFFWGRPNESATLREAVAFSPQSMTADEIDIGMLRLWRAGKVQLLVQVHDSILFQFPEEQENEIIPWALEQLRVHITLKRGRDFCVPTEAQVGWNWGKFDDALIDKKTGKPNLYHNPDGLIKWKGSDSRKRTEVDGLLSIKGLL